MRLFDKLGQNKFVRTVRWRWKRVAVLFLALMMTTLGVFAVTGNGFGEGFNLGRSQTVDDIFFAEDDANSDFIHMSDHDDHLKDLYFVMTIVRGQAIRDILPPDPQDGGNGFGHWSLTRSGSPFDFSQALYADTVFYAIWTYGDYEDIEDIYDMYAGYLPDNLYDDYTPYYEAYDYYDVTAPSEFPSDAYYDTHGYDDITQAPDYLYDDYDEQQDAYNHHVSYGYHATYDYYYAQDYHLAEAYYYGHDYQHVHGYYYSAPVYLTDDDYYSTPAYHVADSYYYSQYYHSTEGYYYSQGYQPADSYYYYVPAYHTADGDDYNNGYAYGSNDDYSQGHYYNNEYTYNDEYYSTNEHDYGYDQYNGYTGDDTYINGQAHGPQQAVAAIAYDALDLSEDTIIIKFFYNHGGQHVDLSSTPITINVDELLNISVYPYYFEYTVILDGEYIHARFPAELCLDYIGVNLPTSRTMYWTYELGHDQGHDAFDVHKEHMPEIFTFFTLNHDILTRYPAEGEIVYLYDDEPPVGGFVPFASNPPLGFNMVTVAAPFAPANWATAIGTQAAGVNQVVVVPPNATLSSVVNISGARHVIIVSQNTNLNLSLTNHTAPPVRQTITHVGAGVSPGRHFNISSSSTLTLSHIELDGNVIIPASDPQNVGGVQVGPGSTFNMLGGSVIRNSRANSAGGGVHVFGTDTAFPGIPPAVVNMSGNATITGNHSASSGQGGGVHLLNYAIFTMSDAASITGNLSSGTGGGVHIIGNDVQFIMNGGSISGNTSSVASPSSGGGGVHIAAGNSQFIFNSGSIVNNHAYGRGGGIFAARFVYADPLPAGAFPQLSIASTAIFGGNTSALGSANPPSNAVAATGIAVTNPANISSGYSHPLNNLDINFFSADSDWFRLNGAMAKSSRVVIHPRDTTGITPGLTGTTYNLIISDPGDGYTITTSHLGGGIFNHMIDVANIVTVEAAPGAEIVLRKPVPGGTNTPNIYPWATTATTLNRHFVVSDGGALTLGGGPASGTLILDGNTSHALDVGGMFSSRGGVQINSNGTLNLQEGGVITNNSFNNGAGVSIMSPNATFNMTGGAISNNSNLPGASIGNGGGVGIFAGASHFTMSGGTIENNQAITNGGGVFIAPGAVGSTLNFNGGTIQNNHAGVDGGGIFAGIHTYGSPLPAGVHFPQLNIAATANFVGNTAGRGSFAPPTNAGPPSTNIVATAQSSGGYWHPLNNLDINFIQGDWFRLNQLIHDLAAPNPEQIIIHPAGSGVTPGLSGTNYNFIISPGFGSTIPTMPIANAPTSDPHRIDVNRNVTIMAAPGANIVLDKTATTPLNVGRHFIVNANSNLTIGGGTGTLTINGNADTLPGNRGGIQTGALNAMVTLTTGGVIYNNRAITGGGVSIMGTNAGLVINGGSIVSNIAVNNGGGVWLTTLTNITLNFSSGSIINNYAGGNGGGIFTALATFASPLPAGTHFPQLTIGTNAIFNGNMASRSFPPPANAGLPSTNIAVTAQRSGGYWHPLNNLDIGFVFGDWMRLNTLIGTAVLPNPDRIIIHPTGTPGVIPGLAADNVTYNFVVSDPGDGSTIYTTIFMPTGTAHTINVNRPVTIEARPNSNIVLNMNSGANNTGRSFNLNANGVLTLGGVGSGTLVLEGHAQTRPGGTRSGVQLQAATAVLNLQANSVIRGSAGGSGGAITIASNFAVVNMFPGSLITENVSSNGGAGISTNQHWFDAQINMYGGTISNNTSTWGGGIWVMSAQFTMYDGLITGNNAGMVGVGLPSVGTTANPHGAGGGVRVCCRGKMVMHGGIISDNTARFGGGVVLSHGTTMDDPIPAILHMHGGQIINNRASLDYVNPDNLHLGWVHNEDGGGVFITNSGLFVMKDPDPSIGSGPNELVISGNSADNSGGGVYWNIGRWETDQRTQPVVMYDNRAEADGGAIYLSYQTLNMYGEWRIEENTANRGGGVFLHGDNTPHTYDPVLGWLPHPTRGIGTLVMHDSDAIFYRNHSYTSGGAVYIYRDAIFDMRAGTLDNNTSEVFGGAVYVFNPGLYFTSRFYATGGEIVRNEAVYGGAVYLMFRAEMLASNVRFAENRAERMGGAIFTELVDYGDWLSGMYVPHDILHPTPPDPNELFHAFTNLEIADSVVFENNEAIAAFKAPYNALAELPNIRWLNYSGAPNQNVSMHIHPLNNYDINFIRPVYFYKTDMGIYGNLPVAINNLEGAVFSLDIRVPHPTISGQYVWEYYTSATSEANGRVSLYVFTEGDFRLREVTPPDGYLLPPGHWYLRMVSELYEVLPNIFDPLLSMDSPPPGTCPANADFHFVPLDRLTGGSEDCAGSELARIRWHVGNMRLPGEIPFEFYKQDHEGNYLAGAEFRLYSWDDGANNWIPVGPVVTSLGPSGLVTHPSWNISHDGQYRLREIYAPGNFQTPPGYWTIEIGATGQLLIGNWLGVPPFTASGNSRVLANRPYPAPIFSFTKTDNAGNPGLGNPIILPDVAVFRLYRWDPTLDNGNGDWDAIPGTWQTGAGGVVSITLPDPEWREPGTQFRLREVTSPDGFLRPRGYWIITPEFDYTVQRIVFDVERILASGENAFNIIVTPPFVYVPPPGISGSSGLLPGTFTNLINNAPVEEFLNASQGDLGNTGTGGIGYAPAYVPSHIPVSHYEAAQQLAYLEALGVAQRVQGGVILRGAPENEGDGMFAPFSDALAATWADLQTAVDAAIPGGSQWVITVEGPITSTTANAIAVAGTGAGGRDVLIQSSTGLSFNLGQTALNERHFVVSGGSSLTLQNITLRGNHPIVTHHHGGVLVAGADSSLIMNTGSVITNNRAIRGGSVEVHSGGQVTINAGEIRNSLATGTTPSDGGGGLHSLNGTVTMGGGTIHGNEAMIGGGLHINGDSIFQLNSGVIQENRSMGSPTAQSQGGGLRVTSSTFNMSGGYIQNNHAINAHGTTAAGGGVHLNGVIVPTTFTMDGGIIRGNRADNNGGGVNVPENNVFNMQEDAVIYGNEAGVNGGGVAVGMNGIFTMDDSARIVRNSAANGGGVSVSNTARFTMHDGVISNNRALSGSGGGVAMWFTVPNAATGAGMFTMYGGSITNNRAAMDGGGIFTTRYLYNNPLNPGAGVFDNLRIHEDTIFVGNQARRWWHPPVINDPSTQLPNIQWDAGHEFSGNPRSWSSVYCGDHGWYLYLLNNYDINYAPGRGDWYLGNIPIPPASLTFTKTDDPDDPIDGDPLDDAEFRLYRRVWPDRENDPTDYTWQPIPGAGGTATSGPGGTVYFPDLPNWHDYPEPQFRLRETVAPDGFIAPPTGGHWYITVVLCEITGTARVRYVDTSVAPDTPDFDFRLPIGGLMGGLSLSPIHTRNMPQASESELAAREAALEARAQAAEQYIYGGGYINLAPTLSPLEAAERFAMYEAAGVIETVPGGVILHPVNPLARNPLSTWSALNTIIQTMTPGQSLTIMFDGNFESLPGEGTIVIDSDKEVHITSTSPEAYTWTHATANSRHFHVVDGASLLLENVVLSGMQQTVNHIHGGVLVHNGELLMVYGSAIKNNRANYGGGVELLGASGWGTSTDVTMLHGSAITGNHALYNGGGVGAEHGAGDLFMDGGTISGNIADGHGGGISGPNVLIYSGTISNNYTEGFGGGIHAGTFTGGSYHVMFTGSGPIAITGNTAGLDGGGIFTNVTRKLFTDLYYQYHPVWQSPVFVANTGPVDISGNTAGRHGGGIYTHVDPDFGGFPLVLADNWTIMHNTAGYDGGGIYIHHPLIANGGRISYNVAGRNGGGVFSTPGYALFGDYPYQQSNRWIGLYITNNIAGNEGGGVFADSAFANCMLSPPSSYGDPLRNPFNPTGGDFWTIARANMQGVIFAGNWAAAAYAPPSNALLAVPATAFTSTSIAHHPINNFDINFRGTPIPMPPAPRIWYVGNYAERIVDFVLHKTNEDIFGMNPAPTSLAQVTPILLPGAQFALFRYTGDSTPASGMVPATGWVQVGGIQTSTGLPDSPVVFPLDTRYSYFQLVEVVPPTGYRPPFGQWRMVLSGSIATGININFVVQGDPIPSILRLSQEEGLVFALGNLEDFELPLAGGSGRNVFIMSGMMLVLIGVGIFVYFVQTKRIKFKVKLT